MVCIFAFCPSGFSCGWFLVSKSEKLNHAELSYLVKFYGLKNVRLRCGDYDFEDFGFIDEGF